MARATGKFKRGNERKGSSGRRSEFDPWGGRRGGADSDQGSDAI